MNNISPNYRKRLLKIYNNINPDPIKEQSDTVLIIDGTMSYIRTLAVVPEFNDNDIHYGGVTGFLRTLGYHLKVFNPFKCIIVFDGKNGSQWRKKLYAPYKENRKNSKITIGGCSDTYSDDQLRQLMKFEFNRLIHYLDCLPVNIISLDNIEADDTIAYMANNFYKTNNVVISSSDKDFFQLIHNRIKVYNPITKITFDEEKIIERFDVHPRNYLLVRLFEGDSSDNIAGIKGIGAKTVLKHYPFLVNNKELVTLDDLFAYSETLKDVKFHQKVLENKNQLYLYNEIMTLTDNLFPSVYKSKIRDLMYRIPDTLDHVAFKKLLIEDLLIHSFTNVDSWFMNAFSSLNANILTEKQQLNG
jgi:DNA polymerase-1